MDFRETACCDAGIIVGDSVTSTLIGIKPWLKAARQNSLYLPTSGIIARFPMRMSHKLRGRRRLPLRCGS